MTHRASQSSSVSRRNRSRTQTHPTIAVQPPVPPRVKQVSRIRSQRLTSQRSERQEESTWPFPDLGQQSEQQQNPQSEFSSIVEDLEHKPKHPQSFDLLPFETQQPQDAVASLRVGSQTTQTPFELTGLRSNSEPSPFLSFQPEPATVPERQFNWAPTPEPTYDPHQPTHQFPQDMSTLGYMSGVAHHFAPLDSSYGSQMDSSSYMMNNHHSNSQPVLPAPSSGPSSNYLPSFSSPSMMQQSSHMPRRDSSGRELLPPYGSQRSPYQHQHSSSLRTSPGPLTYTSTSENQAALSPPTYSHGLPSQPSYSSYPPPTQHYVTSADYMQSYGTAPAAGTTPGMYSPPSSSAGYPAQYAPIADSGMSGMDPARSSSVRVINSRPKPQCWEHGCNGRQFSTFSNLLRHQREKSGTAGKSYCPRCGAEFTRTTAMKGHMNNDKCKPRRASEAS